MATGLGALPFLYTKGLTRRWRGISNAAAAGLMLAASLVLAFEGAGRGPFGVLVEELRGQVDYLQGIIGPRDRELSEMRLGGVGSLGSSSTSEAVTGGIQYPLLLGCARFVAWIDHCNRLLQHA